MKVLIIPEELRQILPCPLSSGKHLNLTIFDYSSVPFSIAKVMDSLLWIAPHTRAVSIIFYPYPQSPQQISFEVLYLMLIYYFVFSEHSYVVFHFYKICRPYSSLFVFQLSYKKPVSSCCKFRPSCWQHCIEEVKIETIDEEGNIMKRLSLEGVEFLEKIDGLCELSVW